MLTETTMTILTGSLPVANHPLFGERWNNYSEKFNALAEILEKSGIDIKLLREVIEASNRVERLGYLEAYRMGYHDAKYK